jgi:tetratricopeptide (TPR) repeat protein
MVLVVSLAVVVLLLGGVLIALKLRPVEASSSRTVTKLDVWKKAVHDNGEDPWNWLGLGLALQDNNDPGGASDAFNKALELEPNNWMANLQVALLIKDQDPERAIKMLNLSGENAPVISKPSPYTALGDILYAQGNYKAARIAFAKGEAAMPDVFQLRMGLGRSLQALGDHKGALEEYKKALQLIPGSREALDAIDNVNQNAAPSPPALPSPQA